MKPYLRRWWPLFVGPVLAALLAVLTVPWIPHAVALRSFEVRPGEVPTAILERAAAVGIVRAPRTTRLWARLLGYTNLKAGRYRLPARLSDLGFVRLLDSGAVATTSVTFPEGWTADEIAARLEAAGVVPARAFLAAARDADLMRQLGVAADEAEGYLFPETYRFAFGVPATSVVRTLVRTFWERLPDDYAERARAVGLTLHEAVILASIIEKESQIPEELPRISAVFHNRLRLGMRLQADPTAIYRMPGYHGDLTREHLRTPTPYNTYVIHGLPAGPICNPGLPALLAAVAPAPTDDLYFVARPDGRHVFAADYATHRRNVERYQLRPSLSRP